MRNRRPLAALLAAMALAVLTALPGGPVAIRDAFAAAPNGRLVVTWHERAPAAATIAGLASVDAARVETSALNRRRSVVIARGGTAAQVAARLQADPRVESVVPDAVISTTDWPLEPTEPDDPRWLAAQGDMRRIGMPAAWPVTTGSASVIVAVLDTGYEWSHEDLAGVPVVFPYNARTGSASVTDGYGHGTHVAGTIAAHTNNALGVAGIAPGVSIMPVKVMDSNGLGYWSDFMEGVDWAVAHGAHVVNLSLGGAGLSGAQIAAFQPTFTAARQAGVLVIAAAGNNDASAPFYPASFGDVLSVAATTNWDTKASFSNFGPWVDIAAPGLAITSTFRNSTYVSMSGTSMATPHVVGLAALVWSLHPEFTAAEVETALKATAYDLGPAGRDDKFGHGRIRAPEALAWLPPDTVAPVATLLSPMTGTSRVSEWVSPTVYFDEAVSGVNATSVTLVHSSGDPVPASVYYNASLQRATLYPMARLRSRATYRIVIGGAITDATGNLIEPRSYWFVTGDSVKPTITAVQPTSGFNVWRGATFKVTFSEKVTNISSATVRLRNMSAGKRVLVTIHYNAATKTVTIDPVYQLNPGRLYRLRLRAWIRDLGGNELGKQTFYFRIRPPS